MNETLKQKPTHFAVDDITFYGMDENNDIIVDDNGEQITYQFKKGVRFKPLEYFCEGIEENILETRQDEKK